MLNNLVGAMIPAKWEFFGQQVGLDQGCLDCIRADFTNDSKQQFNHVFIEWKRRKSSDFTWGAVINALYSKVISEYSLAENILKTLNVPVDVHDETYPKETEV